MITLLLILLGFALTEAWQWGLLGNTPPTKEAIVKVTFIEIAVVGAICVISYGLNGRLI